MSDRRRTWELPNGLAGRGKAECKERIRAKLTELEIEIIETMAAEGMSYRDITQAFERRFGLAA